MDISGKTVLVLGAWGLVGNAVTQKLIPERPKRIIVTSLNKSEALDMVRKLNKKYSKLPKDFFVPWWGNVLVREEFKELDRRDILLDPEKRRILMHDTLDELHDDTLQASALYKLITKYKADIIIDCINTATGIAYQDIYSTYKKIRHKLEGDASNDELRAISEGLLCTMYIPQLIRHIQILYNAMHTVKTQLYFKIGTSGTGGMGLNIPYTHSEEKPSRVLLSKSAVAGAHTLLLFLMGRTPESAIVKELKPTAAIAWKRIEYDTIKKKGKPIELLDVPFSHTVKLTERFDFNAFTPLKKSGSHLKSVFIDTGENGIFSRGEFEAITAQKQMEFVTPEEIADDILFEIKGGNTGHDIINALDNATLNPSYRAGYLQHFAVDKLEELENLHGISSVAFEMLGPPRLSKLLYEIQLLKLIGKTMKGIVKISPADLSKKCTELVQKNAKLRSEMVSIGIGILLPDGKSLLRGNELKIPVHNGEQSFPINAKVIDTWSNEGWVDLRVKNMKLWSQRLQRIMKEASAIDRDDTSSLHVRNKSYWNNFEKIDIGRVVSWLFIHEEKGNRMKD